MCVCVCLCVTVCVCVCVCAALLSLIPNVSLAVARYACVHVRIYIFGRLNCVSREIGRAPSVTAVWGDYVKDGVGSK